MPPPTPIPLAKLTEQLQALGELQSALPARAESEQRKLQPEIDRLNALLGPLNHLRQSRGQLIETRLRIERAIERQTNEQVKFAAAIRQLCRRDREIGVDFLIVELQPGYPSGQADRALSLLMSERAAIDADILACDKEISAYKLEYGIT